MVEARDAALMTAELLGGPRDGEILTLHQRTDELRFVEMPPPVAGASSTSTLRYRLVLVDGLPSVNSAGHYRYRVKP